jgi:P-type Cu+ transporter
MEKKQVKFNIEGMHCASCAVNIENDLKKNPGVKEARVSYASRQAVVDFDPSRVSDADLKKVIEDSGYIPVEKKDSVETEESKKQSRKKEQKQRNILVLTFFLSLPLVLDMFLDFETGKTIGRFDLADWLMWISATIIVFGCGWQIHKRAAKAALHFRANMDTLISLGTVAAYTLSVWSLFQGGPTYFESAALITFFVLLGRYWEEKNTRKAGDALKKLLTLEPQKARLLKDGGEAEMLIDEISVGDKLVVRPGEKIPLDGKVLEGTSHIDESTLTGEPIPIRKSAGAPVFAATINQDGLLVILVEKARSETVFSQIIRAVEDAQSSKAPIEKLADRISGWFVPIVIVISIGAFAFGMFRTGDWIVALRNAISVLVVSCPCALGLATPTAVMSGIGIGWQNGILFKNASVFEKIKQMTMVIFDKTGTLTLGTPKVSNVILRPGSQWNEEWDTEKILRLAVSLASASNHPLSRSIALHAQDKNVQAIKLQNFTEEKGLGLKGKVDGLDQEILLGSEKFMKKEMIDDDWSAKVVDDPALGSSTLIYLALGKKLIGIIALADEVKSDAFESVRKIESLGLKSGIISGDRKVVAKAVAEKLKILVYWAEVMPMEKSEVIKSLQDKGEKVIFVGDGINDAPSLVQADLGIAVGSGADIAKEAGEIILLKNDLDRIPQAIKISRATYSTIRQNLFWAFLYNTLAIPMAFLGLLTPAMAALAMSLSSVFVVSNSLRLKMKKFD